MFLLVEPTVLSAYVGKNEKNDEKGTTIASETELFNLFVSIAKARN